MNRQIRVALVGFSFGHQMDYGRRLADHPDVAFVAVCEPAGTDGQGHELVRSFARERAVPFCDDAMRMLDAYKPEAVSLAVPPEHNPALVVACAQRGIHVMCEKPIGATSGDVAQMAEAVRAAGIKFACAIPVVAYSNAFRPSVEQVRGGAIGTPRAAHFQFLQPNGPEYVLTPQECRKRGRAELANFGPYGILAMRQMFGQPVRSVFARAEALFYDHYRENGVEDMALLSVTMQGGGVGTILVGRTTTQSQSATDCRMQIIGSDGVLNIEAGLGYGLERYQQRASRVAFGQTAAELFVADFVSAIVNDTQPQIGLDESVDVFNTLEAAFQSARDGRRINVDAVSYDHAL